MKRRPTSICDRTFARLLRLPSATHRRRIASSVAATLVLLLCALPSVASAQGVEAADGENRTQPTSPSEASTAKNEPVWLGVQIPKEHSGEKGARVGQVLKESPAARAGLQADDRIIAVDGTEVADLSSLKEALQAYGPGDSVTLRVKRDGEARSVEAVLVHQPGRREIIKKQLVGEHLDGIELEPLSGKADKIQAEDLKGKPLVLEFWATWCHPCRRTAETLEGLAETFGERVRIVGVSSEDRKTLHEYRQQVDPAYTLMRDLGETAHDELLISSYPTLVVVDPEGKIVDVFLGVGHDEPLRKLLEQLLE